MAERGIGQQLDDGPFELANARPDVLGDEPDDILGNRVLEVIQLRLVLQNRDAVFQVGRLDVGDHTPLEATDETRFQSRDLTMAGGRWSG